MFKGVFDKILIWLILPRTKKREKRSSHAGPRSEAGRASWRAAESVRVKFCTNLFTNTKRGAND